MLEALRKSTAGWVAKIFIGLLVLSFAVWGIADIFGGYGQQTVAKVGETEIPAEDYYFEFQREQRILGNRLGRALTVDDARSIGLDDQVLLRMVGDAAIQNQAKELGLGITPKAVFARVQREPGFKGTDGKFSREQFYRLLQSNNLSEQDYLLRQHRALIMQQITGMVTQGPNPPKTLVEAANTYRNETRKLKYITLPLSAVETIAEPTDDDLRKYYDTHKSEFRAPELRKVGFIRLSPDALAKKVTVSDEDIEAYYENNKHRFGTPEKREVQQITFPNKADADAAYEKLKGGTDFMEVAKERGLTEKDVNLGLVDKSGIADEKVADAIFALPENELSTPIEGALATVIAKVGKIVPGVEKTLEDERENIRKRLASEQAANMVIDLYDKIEDERGGGATLSEAAKKFDLEFTELPGIDSRGQDSAGKSIADLAGQPRVVRAIFAAEKNLETDPEETTDNGYVWYEVLDITASRVKEFDEVKSEAAMKWRETQERQKLSAKANELIEKMRGGQSLEDVASSLELTVEATENLKRTARPSGLPAAALQQAFTLKEKEYGSAASRDGKSRAIFHVAEVKKPSGGDKKVMDELVDSVRPQIGDDMIVQYVRALRDAFGVDINQTVFEETTAGRGYAGGSSRGSF